MKIPNLTYNTFETNLTGHIFGREAKILYGIPTKFYHKPDNDTYWVNNCQETSERMIVSTSLENLLVLTKNRLDTISTPCIITIDRNNFATITHDLTLIPTEQVPIPNNTNKELVPVSKILYAFLVTNRIINNEPTFKCTEFAALFTANLLTIQSDQSIEPLREWIIQHPNRNKTPQETALFQETFNEYDISEPLYTNLTTTDIANIELALENASITITELRTGATIPNNEPLPTGHIVAIVATNKGQVLVDSHNMIILDNNTLSSILETEQTQKWRLIIQTNYSQQSTLQQFLQDAAEASYTISFNSTNNKPTLLFPLHITISQLKIDNNEDIVNSYIATLLDTLCANQNAFADTPDSELSPIEIEYKHLNLDSVSINLEYDNDENLYLRIENS